MEEIKTISKIGNSVGVIIPPAMLKELGVTQKGKVRLRSRQGLIEIEPVKGREQRVMQAAAKYLKKYREDFEKLAR